MPEVYVHAVEGRTLEQKRALVRDITDAVVRRPPPRPDFPNIRISPIKIMGRRAILASAAAVLRCDNANAVRG